MISRSLGHRAPLLWLVLPFIGGLAAGKSGLNVAVGVLLALVLVCAADILAFIRNALRDF